jgi:DNA-binding transcriptional regulator YdaS (Cro superfamily)
MRKSATTESSTIEDPTTGEEMTEELRTEDLSAEDLLRRIKRETNERLAALRGAVEERDRLRADLLKVDPPVDVDLASEEAVDEVDAQAQLYELSI